MAEQASTDLVGIGRDAFTEAERHGDWQDLKEEKGEGTSSPCEQLWLVLRILEPGNYGHV